ncbi:MAG: hypothetical protein A3G01_00975 [Candidatus Kerfeldbacteria bacterium RIFCSPLOWO2_12_FULL_43_9]|nr:MAG: hypothetical protein A3G01_00975 [Candidatus Kerfeldbacteria bacterium RIFCSPLOWO2_12_FULL_43_9]
MFSGLLSKYLNLDQFSTHHIVNKLAYQAIFQRRRFSFMHFPSLSDIQTYEGYRGPDGLWIRKQMPTSQHAYNPVNGEGNALSVISSEYDLLQSSLTNDPRTAARSAAYLSHFIVDALDPAHHIGNFKSRDPVPVYDDWSDPFLDMRQSFWKNIRNRHFFFELCSAFYLWRSQHLFLRVPRRPLQFRHKKFYKPQLLLLFKKRVQYVNRFRIYERFFIRRHRIQVKRQILSFLFPLMIRSVSLFWMHAIQQASLGRKTHVLR